MTDKSKATWDAIKPVESTKKAPVADTPEKGVPFGGRSEVQKCIASYRKHFRSTPPERNGKAHAPETGRDYTYFLSEDVFNHADDFVSEQGFMLETMQYVDEHGNNVMQLSLEHLNSQFKKVVEANLGMSKSIADFGARTTYAVKYLVAVMFSVSVQTDEDAFGNGTVSKTDTVASAVARNAVLVAANKKSEAAKKVAEVKAAPAKTATAPTPAETEGPTQSYILAKQFIEKSSTVGMLEQAKTKVENSTKMSDAEKVELLESIKNKVTELG
jgi:hypothetical protein